MEIRTLRNIIIILENVTLNNNGICINFRFQNYFTNPSLKTEKSVKSFIIINFFLEIHKPSCLLIKNSSEKCIYLKNL